MAWDIESLKQHYDQRFSDSDKAVQAALVAQEKAVAAALAATKEAISKAETAAERRFELLNELRTGVATKEQFTAIEKEIASLSDRVTRSEGSKQGSELTVGKIIAIVGISITVLGFVMSIVVLAANGRL